ncbi:MAG: hypothetical protein ACQETO_13790 [Pseudomonadota bacterium]
MILRLLVAIVLASMVMWPDSVGAESTAADAADLERFRDRLQALQQERGIYDPALIEAWGDLAARLSESGEHEEAAASWREALQVSRISAGPYNPDQVRIIERLAREYEEAGDREQADTYHHLLFHTRDRLHEPDSTEWVDAVIDWSDWKLRRSTRRDGNIRPGALPAGELDRLRTLQARALDALRAEEDTGSRYVDDARVGRLLRANVLTALGQTAQVLGQPAYLFDPPLVSQYITRRVCRTTSDGNQVCSSRQVENPRYRRAQIQERSDQAGRELQRARGSLDELRQWQSSASHAVLDEDALRALEQNVTQYERSMRRRGPWGW